MTKPIPTRMYERELWRAGHRRVAGVDEVGRGPWAGPVVAGAVVLPAQDHEWMGRLRDSKAIGRTIRERLTDDICEACDYGIGVVTEADIDDIGIGPATRLAMRRAVESLPSPPEALIVDGNEHVDLDLPQWAFPQGDAHHQAVAAASIVAKVTRDAMMVGLAIIYPGYGFERHKGYGTKQHQVALDKLGPCHAHRRSVRPVREALGNMGSEEAP